MGQTQKFLGLAEQAVAKEREMRGKKNARNNVGAAQRPSTASPQKPPTEVLWAAPAKSKNTAKAKAATPVSCRTLPSGVTVEVLSMGTADRHANAGREIMVQYEGRIAGRDECFDSGSK